MGRFGGGDDGDFEVGHLGLDAGGHLVADGRRVSKYLDRIEGARYLVGQLAGKELTELPATVGAGSPA